eukprot:694017_1
MVGVCSGRDEDLPDMGAGRPDCCARGPVVSGRRPIVDAAGRPPVVGVGRPEVFGILPGKGGGCWSTDDGRMLAGDLSEPESTRVRLSIIWERTVVSIPAFRIASIGVRSSFRMNPGAKTTAIACALIRFVDLCFKTRLAKSIIKLR